MTRDTLYADPNAPLVDFAFDERVAAVFPDMIRRSVPGYTDVVALTGLLAARHARAGTRLYDLGCSLGAVTVAMAYSAGEHASIIAVDNSEAMLAHCRENLESAGLGDRVGLVRADIRDMAVANASVVALNFTLQFIPAAERAGLLGTIARGMVGGGALILSEKVVSPDAAEQAFREEMHAAFKQANGYSELEISRKRAALERVLVPESIDTHRERLLSAGFRTVYEWYRCFNFASLVAVR